MDTKQLFTLAHLSDEVLVARVKQLAAREREATVALIVHLAELDERRLYLAEGCSSLFTYCTQVLLLSEHAAYGRIEAARAARRFPVILGRLEEGAVTLTTVGLLAAHLTEENHRELLDAACHRSKRQVEELVARLRPQPPVPSCVRRLPVPRPSSALASPEASLAGQEPSADSHVPFPLLSAATALLAPTRPAAVVPLAPERYRVQFTASAETCEKLRLAQALLRHQIPDGDPAAIFDRALTALLEGLTKQKMAATDRPREHPRKQRGAAPRSRHIPADVKRTVWRRDAGQCAFVSTAGRRCAERGFLEFHHVVPYGTGGAASVDNIQLRCRAHNGYEAERVFGPRRLTGARETGAAYGDSEEHPYALRSQQISAATRAGPS